MCSAEEAARILGIYDLHEASDHAAAAEATPKHFDLEVPLEVTERLTFISDRSPRPKFSSPGYLDRQTLRACENSNRCPPTRWTSYCLTRDERHGRRGPPSKLAHLQPTQRPPQKVWGPASMGYLDTEGPTLRTVVHRQERRAIRLQGRMGRKRRLPLHRSSLLEAQDFPDFLSDILEA